MAWLPDGDLLIAEHAGRLRLLHADRLDPKRLSGTPAVCRESIDGLQDIAIDPDFLNNRAVYLSVCEYLDSDQLRHAAVYRARLGRMGLENLQRIFRSNDGINGSHSIAGRLLFLSDKTLLVAVNAMSPARKEMAQQLESHIGKILRIRRDGSPAPDNPFVHTSGALPEIWSYGHRVPLGLYEDPRSGEVWEVEAGPLGGDELNLLKAGGNFGWPKASWGFGYDGRLAAPLQSAPGIEDPILIWMPSQDPSGLTRYLGSSFSRWTGDYFVGHLPTRELERLRIDSNHRVILQEKMLTDLEERIRDVKVGPDDRIYILTDNANGRLLRLQPGSPRAQQMRRVAQRLPAPWPAVEGTTIVPGPGDALQGKEVFLDRCAGCHSVGMTIRGERIGPDLAHVCGRKPGGVPGFPYSASMAASTRAWDAVSLNLFLADPAHFVPGTKMAAPPLIDPLLRRQIIAFLEKESNESP